MAPPLISDYKIPFALKRVLQTFLGGPLLVGVPIVLICLQIGLYALPAIELSVVNLLIQHHHFSSRDKDEHAVRITGYWRGLVVGISVLIIDLSLTLLVCLLKAIGRGSGKKKIGPLSSSSPSGSRRNSPSVDNSRPAPATFLAEDDQLDYKGLFHSSTWNYIVPNIFVPRRIGFYSVFLHLFNVTGSSLAFGLCTPLVIDTDLSAILRGFGLFTLCNGRYSAVFHTPFEIATFDTVQQKKDAFYRTFYILLVGFSYFIAECILGSFDKTIFLALLVCLPFLWSLGLLPPLDALFPWVVETILQLFGGSTSLYYFGSFLGILTVIGSSILVLITDEYFVVSIVIQCLFGYIISCDMGLLPKHFKSSSSSLCGSESMPFNKCLSKLIFPAVQMMCSILFVYLGLALFLKDSEDDEPIISIDSKIYVEFGLVTFLLGLIGLIRVQQFYLLGIGKARFWNKDSARLAAFQRLLIRILTIILHLLLTIELDCAVRSQRLRCGTNHEHILLQLSDLNWNVNSTNSTNSSTFEDLEISNSTNTTSTSWVPSQQFKKNTKSLLLLFVYSMTIRAFALGITHPKQTTVDMLLAIVWKYFGFSEHYRINKLNVPVILFLVSFPRKWFLRFLAGLGLFLRILYSTLSTLLIDKKLGAVVVSVFCWPITLVSIILRCLISATTLTPVFTCPIFSIGFPRPNSYWKLSWFPFGSSTTMQIIRTRAGDNNLDYAIYSDIGETLVQAFVTKILDCGFRLNQGHCFLARFDDRLIFLRVLTIGWNHVYIQIKGLEMQEQTSCHHQEAAWIDELFDSTPYLKCATDLNPVEKNEMNSCSFLSYYFKRFANRDLVAARAMSTLNPLFTLTLPTYAESKSSIEPLTSANEKELFKKMFFYSYTYLWIQSRCRRSSHEQSSADHYKSICTGTHLFERRSSVSSASSSMSLPDGASPWRMDEHNTGIARFPHLPGMEPVVESPLSMYHNSENEVATASGSRNGPMGYTKNRQKIYTPTELNWIKLHIEGLNGENETDIHKLVKMTWKTWAMVIGAPSSDELSNNISLFQFFDDGFKTNVEQSFKNHSSKFVGRISSEITVKSFKYAVKLTLDHIYSNDIGVSVNPSGDNLQGDINSFNEILLELQRYEKDVNFCTYKNVAELIQKKQTQIITMVKTSDGTNQLPQLRIFNLRKHPEDGVKVCIGQLSSSVVEGIWSNLNFELLYLTSDDDERYSIQHDKILLRNISTQCANSPLGYFVYDAIFRLNLLDKYKIQQVQ